MIKVSLTGDGSLVAAATMDSQVRLWRTSTGAVLGGPTVEPLEVWGFSMSPDGKYVAGGSQAGVVNLWSVPGYEKAGALETGGKFVISVAISPDGSLLASSAANGAVFLFDAVTKSLIGKLDGHSKRVRALAFTHDSSMLITGGDDLKINLYDVKGGATQAVSSLSGHSSWVTGVAASPLSMQFASCSSDGSVKIWEARAAQCIHTIAEHNDQVWSVAYNKNLLVSVGDDRKIVVHDNLQ